MLSLPLNGIRVLDMTVVWAGPYASMLLADMGAEVIRVESLQHLDLSTRGLPKVPTSAMEGARGNYYPNRDPGKRPWNRRAMFTYAGRQKLSMTADLTKPEGKKLFFELASVSDVLLDNNSTHALKSLGITYHALKSARPDIIFMSFPGYGTTGPYADFKGYGANVEAIVGHTWLRGYPDADPSLTYVVYHADAAAGATAAFAVMAALHHRSRTGQGQFIDMSQAENLVHHLSQAVMDYSLNGRVQSSIGNQDPSMAPHGVYKCSGDDNWVAIAVSSDREWATLCRVIGKPAFASDRRFSNILGRHRNQEELSVIIGAWTDQRDQYEVMRLLQEAGIACGPVIHPREVFNDPHLKARRLFELVSERDAGVHLHPGPAFQLSRTPLHIRGPAPCLGQHNEYVYRHLLGLCQAEYERLAKEKHVGDAYVVH